MGHYSVLIYAYGIYMGAKMKTLKFSIMALLLASVVTLAQAQQSAFQGTWDEWLSSSGRLEISGNNWFYFAGDDIQASGTAKFSTGAAELLLANGEIYFNFKLLTPGLIEGWRIKQFLCRFRLAQPASSTQKKLPETNENYFEVAFDTNVKGGVVVTGFSGTERVISIPARIQNYPVTGIWKEAFNDCKSLTSVTIPNSVTSIGDNAFLGCKNLTSVTIPNSVTSIGNGTFYFCESLTSITIPNSVTSIGDNAFSFCNSLTGITIPNSVTSIGDYAFYGCTSLTSIIIPNNVTSIGSRAFSSCSSLTAINVAVSNSKYSVQNGVLYNKNKTTLMQYPAGKKSNSFSIPDSVTSIGESAFSFCVNLTSITVPNSVTSIGDYAFYGCTSLTGITIPDSVTSIGNGTFYSCDSLTGITIPNSVTSIGEYAFYGCTSLTSVIIPNSVTSIGKAVFSGCPSLTSVIFQGMITSNDFILAFGSVEDWDYNGDLSEKFLAGGVGMYTRPSGSKVWTKR
jgi:hypothetical protein